MWSDKPQARPFQDWVTGTVLPAIRKDGAYIMGEEKVVSGEMGEDEFVLKAMMILQGKGVFSEGAVAFLRNSLIKRSCAS